MQSSIDDGGLENVKVFDDKSVCHYFFIYLVSRPIAAMLRYAFSRL
jgi:hypothetical protein